MVAGESPVARVFQATGGSAGATWVFHANHFLQESAARYTLPYLNETNQDLIAAFRFPGMHRGDPCQPDGRVM
jgi:hypothetical protein